MGDYSYSKGHTVLNYGCRKADGSLPEVVLGKFCSVAHNCTFLLANHPMDRATTSPAFAPMLHAHGQGHPSGYVRGDIVVGNDVWIGANCTILDGVRIGDGAVVAAGSVVSSDVEPYSLVGGAPAKHIRYRLEGEENRRKLQATRWWDFEIDTIKALNPWDTDIEAFIRRCEDVRAMAADMAASMGNEEAWVSQVPVSAAANR
jgi:virginiamycin A acetyltransferase